jgi:hypothetical protein
MRTRHCQSYIHAVTKTTDNETKTAGNKTDLHMSDLFLKYKYNYLVTNSFYKKSL